MSPGHVAWVCERDFDKGVLAARHLPAATVVMAADCAVTHAHAHAHAHAHTHAHARARTHTQRDGGVRSAADTQPQDRGSKWLVARLCLISLLGLLVRCCWLVLRVLLRRLRRARRCRSRLSPKPRPIYHGQGRMLLKKALFTKEGRRALKAGFKGALPASKRRILLALVVLPLRILGTLAGVLRALLARNPPHARARA